MDMFLLLNDFFQIHFLAVLKKSNGFLRNSLFKIGFIYIFFYQKIELLKRCNKQTNMHGNVDTVFILKEKSSKMQTESKKTFLSRQPREQKMYTPGYFITAQIEIRIWLRCRHATLPTFIKQPDHWIDNFNDRNH